MKKIFLIISILLSFSTFAAMDETRCGNAIVTALKVVNPNISGTGETQLQNYWKVICKEIIDEIKNNIDITTSVPVIGVQTGPSTVNATGTNTSVQ